MKTLILMRHGKSSWKDKKLVDIDRPLRKRGHKDVQSIGHLLHDKELIPQKILCSPAKRVRQTVEEVSKKWELDGQIEYVDALYMAEPSTILDLVSKLPDDLERVMVIGHNPGLESLLQMLGKEVESLSTAAVAHIVLPIKSWSELNKGISGELVQIFRPRELK
jgi:phosphohistidine phosphatase